MVGFIKGLFGSKSNAAAPSTESVDTAAVTPAKSSQAYFLPPDDAKTFGDIDYMRTAKAVRRTFPKTVSTGEVSEKEYVVSAMDMEVKSSTPSDAPKPSSPPAEVSTPAVSQVDTASQRRRTDSSMDMFRNMARDIKKR